MAKFKNITTGIVEIVENEDVIALMEASDIYEEVVETKAKAKAEVVETEAVEEVVEKSNKPAKKEK